ncbi:MAG: 2OG-Fe(II) oxygenase [Boseongicola sp.]
MRGQLLNLNPLVAVYDDVFDSTIATAAINAGEDRLEQAAYGTDDGIVIGEKRTNMQASIDQWEVPELTDLVSRLSTIVRLPPENAETTKLLRYEGEQFFDVHVDSFHDIPTYADELKKGGQRLFTTLCYLSEVEGEGQTAFPNLKIAVTPTLGRVLVFANTIPGQNVPHPDATHVGFSATSGLKWVLSVWWRERNYHIPRTFPSVEGDYAQF